MRQDSNSDGEDSVRGMSGLCSSLYCVIRSAPCTDAPSTYKASRASWSSVRQSHGVPVPESNLFDHEAEALPEVLAVRLPEQELISERVAQ